MYNLTHWSISVKNIWTVQHKLKISFRVSGYIYNHPEIPDGEYLCSSSSDIQNIYIDYSNGNIIITTQQSQYYCMRKDIFREDMCAGLCELFNNPTTLREGLTVYLANEAEYFVRAVAERNDKYANIMLSVSQPSNLRRVAVACGSSVLLFKMEEADEYSRLYINSDVSKRVVMNIGKEVVKFWKGSDLITLQADEVYEV